MTRVAVSPAADGVTTAAMIEPADMTLLADPLEFLLAEHYRQLAVLNLIDHLARARSSAASRRRVAAAVLEFFRRDLAAHVEDEERDLFPLLRARHGAEPELAAILDQLRVEHEADERVVRPLLAMLRELADRAGAAPSVAFRVAAAAFALAQRRHLAWENAVFVPMLRRLLSSRDLRQLARAMAARRGASLPRAVRKVRP